MEKSDVKLVIDCGFQTPAAISQVCDYNKITHYFVSHIHGDHAGGLEEIAFRGYFSEHKPYLIIGTELMPTLWTNYLCGSLRNLVLPNGSLDLVATLSTYFNLHQCEPMKWYSLGESGLHLVLYAVRHVGSKVAYAILIRDGDSEKQVLFTCDAVWGNKLPYGAANLIFHECSFSPKLPASVHTHAEELLSFMEPTIQEKTVCVHYDDSVLERGVLGEMDIAPLRLAKPFEVFEI